jgi:hypothetical protein
MLNLMVSIVVVLLLLLAFIIRTGYKLWGAGVSGQGVGEG